MIHAVGPVWHEGTRGEAEQLAGCYRRAIELAGERELKTVAFAAISCGIYGYPPDEAATVAIGAIRAALADAPSIEEVTFVCFEPRVKAAFERALASDHAAGDGGGAEVHSLPLPVMSVSAPERGRRDGTAAA